MLKIDTHAHYLPRDWPDLAVRYGDNRFPVIDHGDDGSSLGATFDWSDLTPAWDWLRSH